MPLKASKPSKALLHSSRTALMDKTLDSKHTKTTTNYVNLGSNVCALVLCCIMAYFSFKNGVSWFSFHPILMTLGWMLCMTTAINAFSHGDLATEWMPVRPRSSRHWIVIVTGGILVLLGFLSVLINKINKEKFHFVSLHAKVGLAALIFMLATMLGGVPALFSLQLKKILPPIYFKLVHSTFGLATFSLGIVSTVLGFFANWWKFGDDLRYFCIVIVLVITFLTVYRPMVRVYNRVKQVNKK